MTQEFWITNISNRSVNLTDLNLTIKPYHSINLLSKHYYYTLEEIIHSSQSGSIFNRNKVIKIRKKGPEIIKNNIEISNNIMASRTKSGIQASEEYYEELDMSDEDFANQNSEMELDQKKGSK